MKTLKRYLRLYKVIVSQFFKVILQSKADFLMGLIGFLFDQILGIAFLLLVFRQIPDLNGWTLNELIFIYGFAQIPRGIDHLFTDNIWMIAWRLVVSGDFDRYMLRPMNVFFQVVSEKLQPDAFGELIIGTILVIKSISDRVVIVDGIHIIMFIISIFAGALIYTSIKLFFATFAFWIKISGPIVQLAYQMNDFAKYPTEIYSRTIRFVITWVIPFAFVAYLPAKYFLKSSITSLNIGIECIIAILFVIISYSFFCFGLSRYESAGN